MPLADKKTPSNNNANSQDVATNTTSHGDQAVHTVKTPQDESSRFERGASTCSNTTTSTIASPPSSTTASNTGSGAGDNAASKREFVGPNNLWLGENFYTVNRWADGPVRLPTPPIDDKGRRGAICVFETSERWEANK
jgi:hypothetical protein